MRIGFDASILGAATRYSGTGRYAAELLRHLEQADDANEYVLYAPAGCDRPRDVPARFAWSMLPRVNVGRAQMLAAYVAILPRRVGADRIDVFHAPTAHPRPSWPPLPRWLPCPLVVTLHDVIPLTFYSRGPTKMPARHRLYYRWNLRAAVNAARIITVSDASKAEISASLRIPEKQMLTVYNGGAADRAEEAAIGDAPCAPASPYILYVGSFEPRKNLTGMLTAYAMARAQGLTHALIVVAAAGSGPASEAATQLRQPDVAGTITVLQAVPDADLRLLYARASMFVFPSLAEGFGLPPLEAMAAGTPVIASDLPALREVIGTAALFVQPGDAEDLSRAMLRLARDQHLRDDLIRAGRERAALFSWSTCASQTLEVYREAVASARRPRTQTHAPRSAGASGHSTEREAP